MKSPKMSASQIAIVSDIHANRWALEAVLADVRRRGVDRIFNLGDSVYGPLDPPGTARLLMGAPILSISGNQDRDILDHLCGEEGKPTLGFVRKSLDFSQIIWLKSLSPTKALDGKHFLCHGTPADDHAYLLEEVTRDGIKDRPPEEVEHELNTIGEPVVLCGHSHRFKRLDLGNGRMVINAGSVGLPAYRDEEPFPHAIENGSPHAVYALLTEQNGLVTADKIKVDYDWDAAAACAIRNGREDWGYWLGRGRV